jgi:DNA primase
MLQQINENADLFGYVSQTMELEKKGNDYWAHCPLHTDLTPSLSFTPAKNSYYCFSCGKSGGIIGYLIDFEKMKFEDAVEKAAKLANLDLSKMCHSKTITFLKKLRALAMKPKSAYEHRILDDSELDKYQIEPVKEWLDEGIEQDVMDLFGVRVDTWQNRIIYPVYDICGNLINIKARTRYKNYKQMKIPKYINYFQVGVMDYFQGLNTTLKYVLDANEIIIFESVKSVMKAYGWGYKNCASAEKHTLTKEQIDLLVKLRVNIVFAYDCDVDYRSSDIRQDIDKLKRVTNVFVIEDRKKLLGGKDTKNAPVDCGEEIWETLYSQKRKVV